MFDLRNKNIYVGNQEAIKGYLGEQVLYRAYSEPTPPEAVAPFGNMFAYDFTSGAIVKYANADSTFGGTGFSLSEELENFAEGGFIVRGSNRHGSLTRSEVFTLSVTIRNNFAVEGQTSGQVFRYRGGQAFDPQGFYLNFNYDPDTERTEYTLTRDRYGAGRTNYKLPPVDTDHIEITMVTTSGSYVDVYINGEFWQSIIGHNAVTTTSVGSSFEVSYSNDTFILYDYKFYRSSLSEEDIVLNYNNVKQRI